MIIGIDATKAASNQKTGVDNTVYQIILHLKKIDHQNTYYLYANNKLDKLLLNDNFIEKLVPGKRFWHKFLLPLALLRDKPDAFLEMSNSLPTCSVPKKIILIHDLAFKHFPESYSKLELKLQENTIKSAIESRSQIIVTLNANKKDLTKYYSVDDSLVCVVPLSFDKTIFIKNRKAINPLKFNEPFFLFVGRLEKRKNVANIVKAFNRFREKNTSSFKLVLVGKPGFGHQEILKEIERSEYKKDIITTGFINNSELVDLMSLAIALLYPSYYEGFGLPILEAFSCELPVITSLAEPLVEVAGNAALTVEADDIDEMSKKMENVANDQILKNKLINSGKEKLSHYDWSITAKQIKALINGN